MNVFLGGTCNNSTWRDKLIPKLVIDYFNPVVDEWTDECYEREKVARETSTFCLFVITPKIEGYFSLAEIVDSSYKKTDSTIYCYLKEDDGLTFTEQQLDVLNSIGDRVTANGSLWLHSLDEISNFFEEASRVKPPRADRKFYDVFISYGRRHSLEFAKKLRAALVEKGYSVWFDKENIAIAVDFQQQIDEGIRYAANFCYVLSPHAVNSVYCSKELTKAQSLNKRIIPVHHVDLGDSEKDIHEEVQGLNWMMFNEPSLFQTSLNLLTEILEQDRGLLNRNCELLYHSEQWMSNLKPPTLLLYGEEITNAVTWIKALKNATDKEIIPLVEHTQYINESRLFSDDAQADVCVIYSPEKEQLYQQLAFNFICAGFCVNHLKIDFDDNSASKEHSFDIIRKTVNIVLLADGNFADNDHWQTSKAFIDAEHKQTFSIVSHDQQISGAEIGKVIRFNNNNGVEQLVATLLNSFYQDKSYLYWRNQYYCRAMQYWKRNNDAILLADHEMADYKDLETLAETKVGFGIPTKLADFASLSRKHIANASAEQHIDVYLCADSEDHSFVKRISRWFREAGKTVYCQSNEHLDKDNPLEQAQENQVREAKVFIFIVPRRDCHALAQALQKAEQLNKYIEPLQLQRFSGKDCPSIFEPYVKQATVIDESLDFGLTELLNSLDDNKEYLEAHRKWLNRCQRWLENQHMDEFLLGNKESAEASVWLEAADENNSTPKPSNQQIEFINKSVKYINSMQKEKEQAQQYVAQLNATVNKNRRKLKFYGIGFVLLSVISAGIVIYSGERIADAQQKTAQAQESVAQAEKSIVAAAQKVIEAKEQAAIAEQQADKAEQKVLVAEQKILDAEQFAARKVADAETLAEKKVQVAEQIAAQKVADANQKVNQAELSASKAQQVATDANAQAKIAKAEIQRENANSEAAREIELARSFENSKDQFNLLYSAYQTLKANQGNIDNNTLFNLLYKQYKEQVSNTQEHVLLSGQQELRSMKHLTYSNQRQLLIGVDSLPVDSSLNSSNKSETIHIWELTSPHQAPIDKARLSNLSIKQLWLHQHTDRLYFISNQGELSYCDLESYCNSITSIPNLDFKPDRIVAANEHTLWLQNQQALVQLDINSKQTRIENFTVDISNSELFISPNGLRVLVIGPLVTGQASMQLLSRQSYKKTFSLDWRTNTTQIERLPNVAVFAQQSESIIVGDSQGIMHQISKSTGVKRLARHSHRVVAGEYSSQLNKAVTVDLNGHIKLWRINQSAARRDGEEVTPVELKHVDWVHSLSVAQIADYNFVYVGTENGQVARYPADIKYLIQNNKHCNSNEECRKLQ